MVNQVNAMGRLTGDPKVNFLQGSNNSVTRFCIAVERDYKAAGEEKPKTDFINCVAWNKTGEFVAKYFKKGSMIFATGSIETGSYEKDGKKIYTTEVNVSKVSFTGERAEGSSQPQPDPEGYMPYPDDMDEPPFR